MAHIVPKSKAPGADFCGVDEYVYIVRSDLGCYMRSTSFHEGLELEVFSLHPSCRGGDHYLASDDHYFYIIRGNNYRRVTDMSWDSGAVVFSLHPNCRGGDHYLSACGFFYIIFQAKGVFRKVTDLNTDVGATEYTLHPGCRNGLYYWGSKDSYYFIKSHDERGGKFHRCTDPHYNVAAMTYSFHKSVLPFISGGLGINQGAAFGEWQPIKSITNDSRTPILWNDNVTKKVGYTKEEMASVERNWKINLGPTYESGALTAAIAKYQFSLPIEYGGKAVSTEQENWSEATEVEESISVTLQPKSQIYIWQYQLGLGKETILFCNVMTFTDESTPPTTTTMPLPPSTK